LQLPPAGRAAGAAREEPGFFTAVGLAPAADVTQSKATGTKGAARPDYCYLDLRNYPVTTQITLSGLKLTKKIILMSEYVEIPQKFDRNLCSSNLPFQISDLSGNLKRFRWLPQKR
jgi:hypothetical protein